MMKYRLLMLSPIFADPETVPLVVREDVAEACAIIEYDTPEELSAKLQDAVKLLADQVQTTPA